MADNRERFVKTYKESALSGHGFEIWVDKETGVNYLWREGGYSGGLTVLLDRDGKPVITAVEK